MDVPPSSSHPRPLESLLIAPRTGTATGDKNVRALMQQVINHFNQGRLHGFYPPATSIVLAAVYEQSVALPDAVNVIRAVLERLGLPVRYEEHRVREQGQARASGETSLVIHGRSGAKPGIYVNDQLLQAHGGHTETSEEGGSEDDEGDSEDDEGGGSVESEAESNQ
ncbi:hypothetical protein LTR82_018337, partial [Friedmanniomyces endolithicus]